jgi:hypothetical protein
LNSLPFHRRLFQDRHAVFLPKKPKIIARESDAT